MKNTNEHNPFNLSAEERDTMTRSFRAYMDMHPVQRRESLLSPYFAALTRFPAYAFATLLFILTGTTYAAELSLPNDPLYPVKTHVIEPVFIQAPAVTKHSKARASSALATRRLEEAGSLADQKELNAELAAYLEHELDKHTDAVHAYVVEASQAGELGEALEVSTELETALEAHSEVLESVSEDQGGTDTSIKRLIEDIQEETVEAAGEGDRLEADAIVSVNQDAQEFVEESREVIEETIDALHKENVPLSADKDNELVEEARNLLNEAEASYSQSNDAQAAGNTKEAVEGTRDALRAVKRAVILIDSFEELSKK